MMRVGDTVKFVCKSGIQASNIRFRDKTGEWAEVDLLNKVGQVVSSGTTRAVKVKFPEVHGPVTMFDHPDDFEILEGTG